MSAIGTKRTCELHRTCPLLGVKRHGDCTAKCPRMTETDKTFSQGLDEKFYACACAIASTINFLASVASPQPTSFTHLPGSRSL